MPLSFFLHSFEIIYIYIYNIYIYIYIYPHCIREPSDVMLNVFMVLPSLFITKLNQHEDMEAHSILFYSYGLVYFR